MSIDDYRAKQTAATEELTAILRSLQAGGGDGGGGEVEPPPPSSGLPARFANAKEIWRFTPGPLDSTGAAAAPGWDVFNGGAKQNGEGAFFLPENAAVDFDVDGSLFLRMTARKQVRDGYLYTAAMMENTKLRVGNGRPFYAVCRYRWEPYWGCWVGPWLYNFGTTIEIDVAESVNFVGPTFNTHLRQTGPQTGSKSTRPSADFDVTQWHDYGVGVDASGVYSYVDGVETLQAGAWWAAQYLVGSFWPKFQHSLLGWWPRDDAQRNGKNADVEIAIALQTPKHVDLAGYTAYEVQP